MCSSRATPQVLRKDDVANQVGTALASLGAERRRSFRGGAFPGFEGSIHRAILVVCRRCFACEENGVIDRRRKRGASIPAPNSDITVGAACERVAAPIVRKAALELLTRELGLVEQSPEAVQRAHYELRLCNAAQRDRLRAPHPRDDECAADRQLRPIRHKRLSLAAKERGITIAPVSNSLPERRPEP